LNREHGDRYSEMVGLFQRQVNAAYVDPDYIAKVRRKLDLDQRQAAELFGGGVNAFSRYENGKTKPPLALVKLFKLLDRHPDLLTEVRTARPSQNSPFRTVPSENGFREQPDHIDARSRHLLSKPSRRPSFARRQTPALAYFKFRFLRRPQLAHPVWRSHAARGEPDP
jgi:transcriptional regulator with XRE-family HTH domain